MKSHALSEFYDLFWQLPDEIRKQARKAYRKFAKDPQHPSLHFKRVSDNLPRYSIRITRGYRAVGFLDGDTIIWYWIGTHSDYEKLLKRQ